MIHESFGKGKCLNGNKPNDKIYTPAKIAKTIIDKINNKFNISGKVLDAFSVDNIFYDNYPSEIDKDWCEIDKDRDFFCYDEKIDWIITNPPYSIFERVLDHSFEIAENIVYLVPLSKVVSSMGRIRQIEKFGGVPYIYILGASKCGFPFGFPCCAIYIKKGYKGTTEIEIDN